MVLGAVLHHHDGVALLEHPVHDPHQNNHAKITVIPAVHEHRLERRRAVALGRRQKIDDGLKRFLDANTGLCRNTDCA